MPESRPRLSEGLESITRWLQREDEELLYAPDGLTGTLRADAYISVVLERLKRLESGLSCCPLCHQEGARIVPRFALAGIPSATPEGCASGVMEHYRCAEYGGPHYYFGWSHFYVLGEVPASPGGWEDAGRRLEYVKTCTVYRTSDNRLTTAHYLYSTERNTFVRERLSLDVRYTLPYARTAQGEQGGQE